MVLPKGQTTTTKVESVIPSTYAKGNVTQDVTRSNRTDIRFLTSLKSVNSDIIIRCSHTASGGKTMPTGHLLHHPGWIVFVQNTPR
ncbi:MAG: hypothetical protein IPN86_14775 [Saprospiraceae bacterium]|nr:hypothetical protein [Saprospiraceae bacterium]